VDFAFEGEGVRFRGNAFFQRGSVSIALAPHPEKDPHIQELNLPDILLSFARKSQGFFLVVGPVGQGKTTTLASLIESINLERLEHIVTIEDPIEYIFEPKQSLIDQREVRIDTKDFPTALQSAFRQDIDVLLVGEMRGPETMAAAVTAAETGHLGLFHASHQRRSADHRPHHRYFPIHAAGPDTSAAAHPRSRAFSRSASSRAFPAASFRLRTSDKQQSRREPHPRKAHARNKHRHRDRLDRRHDRHEPLARGTCRKGEITVESAYQYSLNPNVLNKLL
jgi:hypothetical protein